MSKKQLGRAERNRRIVNTYREGFSIDDIIAQSGFKIRSSDFRILNESGVDLNRCRTKGPLGPRKNKKKTDEEA